MRNLNLIAALNTPKRTFACASMTTRSIRSGRCAAYAPEGLRFLWAFASEFMAKAPNAARRAAMVLMLAAACTNHKSAAMQYATAHAGGIVNSTRPLWVKYTALHADVLESEYTPDIRELNPKRVVVGHGGVWMYIYSVYWNVTGIFVRYDPAFPTPSTAPSDSDQMTYVRLGRDVYWFSKPR